MKIIASISAIWISALLATSLNGCDFSTSCTAIGCLDAVPVTIIRSSWDPGEHELEVVLAEELVVRMFQVPGPSTAPGDAGAGEPNPTYPQCRRLTGPPRGIPVSIGGIEEGQKLSLFVNGNPEELTVTLRSPSGESLVSQTVRPTYVRTYPNGPGCGTCDNADPVTIRADE